jgi:trigger factor
MELQVNVEKPSNILRKLTIKVPATRVANRFERGLAEVQKTANLKGFRPGNAPISVIKQFYGNDVRHRVYHSLIDETFQEAIVANKIQAVGRPQIDTPDHKTGEGEHDHAIHEDKDFTYIATVEVLPEIEVKGYAGIALTKEKVEVKKEDVEKVIQGFVDQQSQLVPVSGGLALADGSTSSRPLKTGDYAEINFKGGMVTENGIDELPGMSGSRLLELGSNALIPGFEEELVGMRRGETKTFRITFPKDFYETSMAGKESEFTVTVNEVKEKKSPELDDEFAKQMGYENLADMRAKAEQFVTQDRTDEVDRKLRSDLLSAVIEKNPFDVPAALIESQTRALVQDWAQELKRQGIDDQSIQGAISSEIESIKKRADSQVRASLVLEAIAKKESIEVKDAELEGEFAKAAEQMKLDVEKLKEFYGKNPARQEDFVFRLRQERTVAFLLEKAKIKGK